MQGHIKGAGRGKVGRPSQKNRKERRKKRVNIKERHLTIQYIGEGVGGYF